MELVGVIETVAHELDPLAAGRRRRPERLMVPYRVADACDLVFAERKKGAQYLFCFHSPALGVVLLIPAYIVEQARINAHHHEPLKRHGLHPVLIRFDVDEGGALDADASTVENAMAKLFVIAGSPSRGGA